MGPFILAVLAGVGYAWWKGKLKGYTYEDGIAAVLFLLGLRLLTTGRMLIGAALMAGALLYGAWRRKQAEPAVRAMPIEDARRLLGVRENASPAEIGEAHRRLIARVHPDVGGSAELARRVNIARDTLIADIQRRTPRAS